MTAKIKSEMSIGISDEIKSALEIATEFVWINRHQFARQAILEKLVREGFMRHPCTGSLGKLQCARKRRTGKM